MLSDLLLWGSVLTAVLFILYIRYIILGHLITQKIYLAQRIMEKNREKAIRALTSVLVMEKDNPMANWLMAQIYNKSHHLIIARMYLNDILHYQKYDKEVTEARVRENLADIFRHMGDTNRALTEYYILKKQTMLSQNAVKSAIRLNLSNARYVDARQFMSYGLLNFKEIDSELDYLMAMVDFHHADFASAEMRLKYAIEKGYNRLADVHHLLGKISFIRGHYVETITYLEKLPSSMLETPENWDLIGQCYYFTHNYPSAIKTLEKLVPLLKNKKDRSIAEPVYVLGCAYEASGDLPKAVETWELIEVAIPYYQNAVHKLYFYNKIVTEISLQDLIISPPKNFLEKSAKLLGKMEYTVTEKIFEDDKTLEYICSNRKDLHTDYRTLVVITRETQALHQDTMRDKMNLLINRNGKYLIIIAPMFSTEAIHLAEKSLVTTYTFDVFTDKGIV